MKNEMKKGRKKPDLFLVELLFTCPVLGRISFNPFTAPACKISGLKNAETRLQTVDVLVL